MKYWNENNEMKTMLSCSPAEQVSEKVAENWL